jgi:putative transposase
VIVRKAFRYRIYPSDEQIARIGRWEGALRFLWNLALEQRLMGLARSDKRYPTAFDQINELTELRTDLPWLADVPRNVCAQILVELDLAWQRCFKRIARKPRWKRKGKKPLNLTEPHSKAWRLDGMALRFPKLGWLPIVLHRPIEGKPTRCTVSRDGDQWFASILCEIDAPDPKPRIEPKIALDRGITHLFATSEGRLAPNPRWMSKSKKHLARAQRVVARRKKGSANQEKAKRRVMRLHRKVRRQREHVLHVESARLAKSHGTVVVEKLNVAGMVKGRLAANISDAGWSRFAEMLRYKLAWSGGRLIEVPAAYSSQTCAACGHADKESRYRETFCCTKCMHTDHADINAALVLLTRAVETTVTACGGSAVGRPTKQELRVVRRGTRSTQGLGSYKASAFRPG